MLPVLRIINTLLVTKERKKRIGNKKKENGEQCSLHGEIERSVCWHQFYMETSVCTWIYVVNDSKLRDNDGLTSQCLKSDFYLLLSMSVNKCFKKRLIVWWQVPKGVHIFTLFSIKDTNMLEVEAFYI